MPAQILDGKALAQQIRSAVGEQAARFRDRAGRPPGLSVVLVGGDPASQVYVRNKQAACKAAGIRGEQVDLPETVTRAELLGTIDRLNADPDVDGILLQLPLPKGLAEEEILERIDPLKDVDGFHPINAGLLATGRPRFVPCTPLGIRHLLAANGIATRGRNVVVLGRSNIVGKPMGLLFLLKGEGGDATVTICHRETRDIAAVARSAEILVVAMGRPESVDASWVGPGAVVVDVGIHRRADGSLCGDVRYPEVAEIASWITPVPGGVGPLTVAMLLRNTLLAAESRAGLVV